MLEKLEPDNIESKINAFSENLKYIALQSVEWAKPYDSITDLFEKSLVLMREYEAKMEKI